MALTLDPALSVKFTFNDESNSHGSVIVHLPSATTAAAAKTAADTLAADLAAISGCVINAYSISYEVEEPSPALPAAGSRVEHKARILMQKANGGTARMEVPGVTQSLVLSDGAVDTADAGVIALTAALTGGGWCGSDGSDITNVYAFFEAFKASTKRQLPSRRLAV